MSFYITILRHGTYQRNEQASFTVLPNMSDIAAFSFLIQFYYFFRHVSIHSPTYSDQRKAFDIYT